MGKDKKRKKIGAIYYPTTETLSLEARLGGPIGPILAAHPAAGFDIRNTAATRLHLERVLPDGSSLCGSTISMTVRHPDLDFALSIWGEGGTFEDSTLRHCFSSNEMDEKGRHYYRMICPPGGSLCHTGEIRQRGIRID